MGKKDTSQGWEGEEEERGHRTKMLKDVRGTATRWKEQRPGKCTSSQSARAPRADHRMTVILRPPGGVSWPEPGCCPSRWGSRLS